LAAVGVALRHRHAGQLAPVSMLGPPTMTAQNRINTWTLIYCLKCTKFGQLITRKIIKIVATRCQILRPKCTTFYFGWGSAPVPPRDLTVFH